MKPKIRTIYVDCFRLLPNLTQFIERKKLKSQFGFLIDPILFKSEYSTQSNGAPRKFIHHLGALRPLSPNKLRYPFWRNLFGGTSLKNYVDSYLGDYFGYLPYFIKPSWKMGIELDAQTDTEIAQILNRAKLSLTARLFPIGATAIHLMVFFPSEQAEVEHFIEIQKMLLYSRLFRVTENRSVKLLTLEEIFNETQSRIYSSLFVEQPKGTLEAQPGEIHRVVYLDLLSADGLTNVDIQMAATSLISLNTVRTQGECVTLMENRLKCTKCPGTDLIIFHPKSTLLYTPGLDPYRDGFCLWNNYINVVEMATLQNFVLRKASSLLEQALSLPPNSNFTEFADSALFLKGLGYAHQSLRGGHKHLYNEIDKKLRLSKTIAEFFDLLGSYAAYQSYCVLNQQIESMEKTLTKIKEVAGTIGFNQIGLLLVDDLLDRASYFRNSFSAHTQTLGEIEGRKRRGNRLPNDPQNETSTKIAIMDEISKYRNELLSNYVDIVEELLNTEEKANIDITLARIKLEDAKQKGGSCPPYTSTQDFVKVTRKYVDALLEASSEALKTFA